MLRHFDWSATEWRNLFNQEYPSRINQYITTVVRLLRNDEHEAEPMTGTND
jgi:hypothetical protein